MPHQTAEEAKKQNIEKMGEPLGAQYSVLWQEVIHLFMVWSEFVALYGTKASRVDLLNSSAPNFFHMVQDVLWEGTMLHVARLTDATNSQGRKDRSNLTIQNLPELIGDAKLKAKVVQLVDAAAKQSEFCRDWRNRHIAHRDLNLALNQSSTPLAPATVKQTTDTLKAIAAVLNAVQQHYQDGETIYDFSPHQGAVSLLYVLDDGIKAHKQRLERIKRGEILDEDFQRDI